MVSTSRSPEAALNSQLGPDGAIVRYLRDAGVKPGTDLVNLYSAVNAGTVGQTGAVDRGTTVSQKVAGMRDHETKAASLLGGQWTPPAGSAVAAAPTLYEPQPSEDRNAEFEALLASRPEAARDAAPRSLLADTMASSVGRRSSGGGGLTPTVADQNAAVPITDLAPAAAPEAAPITDSRDRGDAAGRAVQGQGHRHGERHRPAHRGAAPASEHGGPTDEMTNRDCS